MGCAAGWKADKKQPAAGGIFTLLCIRVACMVDGVSRCNVLWYVISCVALCLRLALQQVCTIILIYTYL